jgi:hypothetical protein
MKPDKTQAISVYKKNSEQYNSYWIYNNKKFPSFSAMEGLA